MHHASGCQRRCRNHSVSVLIAVLQVKYWRAMEGHASRDLMTERLLSRRLAEEIESIVTGAYTDNNTITGMRLMLHDLQCQVQQLQAALDEQREQALRKEQQLVSDYKRSLRLNTSGNPRYVCRPGWRGCNSHAQSHVTRCAGTSGLQQCSARGWSISGCLRMLASFRAFKQRPLQGKKERGVRIAARV
jgi:hypothetical protein